jgi:hypothetical protein
MSSSSSTLTVNIDGHDCIVPRNFSQLLINLTMQLDVDDIDEETIKIEHHPAIFHYYHDKKINSLSHLLEIINSAIFYQVPEEYSGKLRYRFWVMLPHYDGPFFELSLYASNFLDIESNLDVAIACYSKFRSCARVSLKVTDLRAQFCSLKNLPFDVVELNLTNLNRHEHEDIHRVINAFADTLERLTISTINTLANLEMLPNLKYLDLRESNRISSLKFFTASLEELHISGNYDDNFISRARKLKKLNVSECPNITTVEPFTELQVLDASDYSGINDAGLATAKRLVKLNASDNRKITTVAPFASTLEELNASDNCGINDAGLKDANNIIKLCASDNPKITTVAPFARCLRELSARDNCGINDEGLARAYYLESLTANFNPKITTVAPFAKTLRYLSAIGTSGIGDKGLTEAENIEYLCASYNRNITTVKPFAHSLLELEACQDSGINDAGLKTATKLTRLYAGGNSKITTVRPFAKTLRELAAHGMCGISDAGLAGATNIEILQADHNHKITIPRPRNA